MNICNFCKHESTCSNKPLATTRCADYQDKEQENKEIKNCPSKVTCWSIGTCSPFAKTKSLYLYCQEGGVLHIVARFRNPLEAERFAQTWGYPLSDNIKQIIEDYKKGTIK